VDRRRFHFGITVIVAVLLHAPSRAQEPASSQQPSLRTGATAVILDVVVRDRHGHPVRDIQASELAVLEDGMGREVKSFRLIDRTAKPIADAGQPSTTADALPDALRYPALVTLVFDHLTQNGRTLARRAALQFVSRELPANQWVAVYSLEQRLRISQPFTRDSGALKQAIERATITPSETRDRLARSQADQETPTRVSDAPVTVGEGTDTSGIGGAVSEARIREIMSRMACLVEAADLQQRGQSTLFPLMALVKAQSTLAGRKALVLFSEGLPIPPNLEEAYRSTISEANRANVSIYTVDARGLDTGRSLEQSQQMLDRSGRNSQSQLVSGSSQRPVTMDDVMNSETAEGALKADTQNALRAMAEETSGALIANTNDLGPGLTERVRADMESYYEIAYTPASTAADGRFRPIEVKIARRGVELHSRSGYFALPESDAAPLMPYELPMLTAASANPPPHAFEYGAAAFRFDRTPKGMQHTLVVEVPLENLTLQENRRQRTYALRFTAMALVKDQSGQVVQRFSESYPLEGPIDRVPALKRGRLRFKRQIWLPAGRYTLWTIARDQATERSSVKTIPLVVPEPNEGVRISDLAVIRGVDQAGDVIDAVEDPFRTGAMRVVPNLDLPISRATNTQVSAYVTIYPDTAGATPSVTFEFRREGAVIGRSSAELPAADESGRIKYVASFPTQTFGPGTYELRAVATQGTRTATSQTQFTIVP
jgi:VWFA-related protein